MEIDKKRKRGIYESAGGLLWREHSGGTRLAVVHRPRYDDWTLPKGTLKKGETWQEAALREIHEETGCEASLEAFAGCVCYQIYDTPKVVLFWHMHVQSEGERLPDDEIDQVVWLSVAEALERLSYEDERKLLREASHP
ncbi:MAG: NUDIX hydrolase [Chloroflexota bacterium]